MSSTNTLASPNEPRFVCKSCARSFRRVEHLRRHETTHTGTRSHVCPNCSSTFFRGDVLVRHMRNVHRAIVSGVKELRMAGKASMVNRGLNAAGTSASHGMAPLHPNPGILEQRTDAVGQPLQHQFGTALPSKAPEGLNLGSLPHSSSDLSYGHPWSYPQYSSESPPPPLQQQLFPAYSPSQMRMLRLFIRQPLQNGLPISASNQILSAANPPMENLIAYGYGPYAPNVPGWTDTALGASSAIPASSKHITEHLEEAEVAFKRRGSSYSSVGSDGRVSKATYRKDSRDSFDESSVIIDGNGSDHNFSRNFKDRDHYLDFIPVHRSSLSSSDYEYGDAKPVFDRRAQRLSRSSDTLDSGSLLLQREAGITIENFDREPVRKGFSNYPELSPSSSNGNRTKEAAAQVPQRSTRPEEAPGVTAQSQRAASTSMPRSGVAANSSSAETTDERPTATKSLTSPDSLASPAMASPTSLSSPSAVSPTTVEESCSYSSRDKSSPSSFAGAEFDNAVHSLQNPANSQDITAVALARYISYFSNYSHPIMPIIHKPTFDVSKTRPALLFAICSLSASVLQEESAAKILQANAERLLYEDWRKVIDTGRGRVEIEEWVYFVHTSLFLEWYSFAFASSSETLNAAFKMRDFQEKLVSVFPGLLPSDSNSREQSYEQWVKLHQVVRAFATLFSLEYVAVCSYGLEPRTRSILNACRELPLPSAEHIWSTAYKNESDWKTACLREDMDNVKNPHTFDELFSDVETFDIDKLQRTVPTWRLPPVSLLSFSVFVFVECEVKWGRGGGPLPKAYSDVLALVSSRLKESSSHPGTGNIDSLRSLYETSHGGASANQINLKNQLVPTWQRIWQNQHPLVALSSMVIESSHCGLFVNVSDIKERVREFDIQGIGASILRAMYENRHKDLSRFLPVVGIIVDFVRFSLVSGTQGPMRFNMLFSASFTRTVSVLLGHRSLTFFCCWIFGVELRIRSGQKVSDQELRVFHIVEKSCKDYEMQEHFATGRKGRPTSTRSDDDDTGKLKNSVSLPVTAAIVSLLGTFTDDINDGVPIQPYYYALQNIGNYLRENNVPLMRASASS